MRFSEYIKKTRAVDGRFLAKENSEKLLNFLEAGIPLSELALNNKDLLKALPGAQLRRLIDARRNWQSIEEAREQLVKTIAERGESVPSDALFDMALSSKRMEALSHILPLFPRSAFDDDTSWREAIEVALGVWTGALNQSMKKGSIYIETNDAMAVPVTFEEVTGNHSLSNISNEKWHLIGLGLEEKLLSISYEFPVSSIASHLEGVFDSLGAPAAELGMDAMLDKLVLHELPGAISINFDRKVLEERLKNLGNMYLDVLKTPPIKVPKMGAFCHDEAGEVAGLTVINDKGKVIATQSLDLEESWWERVRVFFVEQKTTYIAVPGKPYGGDAVEELRENEGNFLAFIPVKSEALDESAKIITDRNESDRAEVSAAIALARRLIAPVREWSQLDPISLLPSRLTEKIDPEVLGRYLLEQKGMALMDPSLERIPPRTLPAVPSGHATSGGRLNPSIKNIEDVKVGMTLKGIVINLTKFGAFVNIGLSQEALIHVSEMSDTFVNDPSEIVTLGQQVDVTVVNVDLDKGRISLSLRTNPRVYDGKPPRARFDDRRRGRDEKYQSPAVRSQALKDLENLFKK